MTAASVAAGPTLPIRIRCTLQTYLIGCAFHVEDAGLVLAYALACVFHDEPPSLVAAGHRIDGDFEEIAFADEILKSLRRLLLIVGVIVDHLAQCGEVAVKDGL